MTQISLNVRAPINQLGYGVAARNIIKALHYLGVRISLWPIGPIQCREDEKGLFQQLINNQANYDANSPSLVIFHQFALAEHIGRGPHIGFPIFELDKFTDREINHLRQQSRLFVTSKWAKNIIHSNGIQVPTYVIPLGVDRTIFNENVEATVSPNKTVFCTVGKWEIRKGHDFLIDCFNKAFTKSDSVLLYMCCDNPFLKPNSEQLKFWTDKVASNPNIHVVNRFRTQAELARFMASCDIGVFPSHSEGWGLECLEFLSLGKQVIATFFSAHCEFLNNNNAYLIETSETEPAFDGIWFDGKVGSWASLSKNQEEQLINYMRTLHQEKEEIGQVSPNLNGLTTAQSFSWENSARKIVESLQ